MIMLDTLDPCHAAYRWWVLFFMHLKTKTCRYERKIVIWEKVRGMQDHLSVTFCQVIGTLCRKVVCYTVDTVSIRTTKAQTHCSTYRSPIRSSRGKVTLWPRFRNGEPSSVSWSPPPSTGSHHRERLDCPGLSRCQKTYLSTLVIILG